MKVLLEQSSTCDLEFVVVENCLSKFEVTQKNVSSYKLEGFFFLLSPKQLNLLRFFTAGAQFLLYEITHGNPPKKSNIHFFFFFF